MQSYLRSSSSVYFLLHSYLKMMRNALWAPFLLQCSFLIIFLLKNDEKCSLGSVAPRLIISDYILIQK